MSGKRAPVPSTTFGKVPGALDKLTGRAPIEDAAPEDVDTVLPQDSNTVLPQSTNSASQQHANTASQQRGSTVTPRAASDEKVNTEKFTVYISPAQMDKLDELALAYRKRTGRRINRNVLMRKLIDVCDLELLLRSDAE